MGELTKAMEKIGLQMRVTALVSIKWRVVIVIVLLIKYPDFSSRDCSLFIIIVGSF